MRALITLSSLLAVGCVVNEDLADDTRELIPTIKEDAKGQHLAHLEAASDGSGVLQFTFHYELGLIDEEGIAEVQWRYSLITVEREPLATFEQRMRKPEPGRTQILVQGDRPRKLEVPAGRLQDGETYVLWIEVSYRGELLGELLHSVTEGGEPPPMETEPDPNLPDAGGTEPGGPLPLPMPEVGDK